MSTAKQTNSQVDAMAEALEGFEDSRKLAEKLVALGVRAEQLTEETETETNEQQRRGVSTKRTGSGKRNAPLERPFADGGVDDQTANVNRLRSGPGGQGDLGRAEGGKIRPFPRARK